MEKVSFNNKNSVFFNALRKKVNDYFQTNQIKPTGNIKLYFKSTTLLASAIALYLILVFFTPTAWVSVLLSALLGFNMAAIGFNIMHDGAHGSFSERKWVNELMGYSLNMIGGSVYLWKFKHNFNHHSFTNIDGMDDDIDIKPWIRVSSTQEKYWFHRFQYIYWVFLYGWTYLLWIYWQDFQKYFTGKVGETKFRKMDTKEHLIFWITKIAYVAVFVALPIYRLGIVDAMIGYFVIAFVCGFVSAVVFQLAHVVEHTTFPMPDEETSKINVEWAIHQIQTTANFATRNKIVSWFTGGLNFQVEHHLFPKISHIHYPKINELVRETCQQFGIEYLEYPSVLSALRSHVMYLKQVGVA